MNTILLRRLLPAIVFWAFAHSTFAFNSTEHEAMGQIAIAVAEQAVSANELRYAKGSLQALRDIEDDYGFITRCVDYFLYPEKMLAYRWKRGVSSGDSAEGKYKGIPRSKDDTTEQFRQECDKQGVLFAQATHSNHAHFQQDLVMSIRVWHLLAVTLPKGEANLYGGLFVNAISDHYLQDFFAPGHIVTARDRLTDLPATATHDLANQMGAVFLPRLTPKMVEVLNLICPVSAGDTDCVVNEKVAPLLVSKSQKIAVDHLPDSAKRLRGGEPIIFKGDSRLGDVSQATQRLFLLCVQVSSVLDVLDGENGLTDFDYSYRFDQGLPRASADFGAYDFGYQGQVVTDPRDLAPVAPSKLAADSGDSYIQATRLTPCSVTNCTDRLYEIRTRSPIVSVSDQRESQSSGQYSARDVYSIEVSASGWLWNASRFFGRWVDDLEIVPTLGYSLYHQGQKFGNGPTLRFALAIPETEFSVGFYTRWLSYPEHNVDRRRLTTGLRLEAGFSSYFTFYVIGGYDYSPTLSGDLVRGRVWGGGIRVGAPFTRLPFVSARNSD